MPLNIAETNRSGDYWANTIGGIGNMIAGHVQQYAETKKQVNANNAFFKMVMPANAAAEATKQKPGESMTEFAARQDAIKNATLFKMQKEKADAEMEETRARIAAMQAKNQPQPVPFSQGIGRSALPGGGGNVFFDQATGEAIPNSNIQKSGLEGNPFVPSVVDVGGKQFGYTSKGSGQYFTDPTQQPPADIVKGKHLAAVLKKAKAGDEDALEELEGMSVLAPEMSPIHNIIRDIYAAKAAKDSPPEPSMSQQDQEALKWANANPSDPRSAAIKKKLGK